MVLERGFARVLAPGQRDPQLRRVQARAFVQRVLGVGDAAPGGHQVDLAGTDDLFVAQRVAVHHLALDEPGEGLQADVRVRAHVHAGAGRELHRAGVVEEAPGAHQPALAVRQGARDGRVLADDGDAGRVALRGGGHGWLRPAPCASEMDWYSGWRSM
jgi:hypothetical protein